MRTTVTVDHDVEQLLREAMRRTGQSFKVTLNQAIRKGLAGVVAETEEPPFVVKAKAMGTSPGVDPARLQELGDELEIVAYLELARKLQRQQRSGRSAS
jgi:hypothetical protein